MYIAVLCYYIPLATVPYFIQGSVVVQEQALNLTFHFRW